MAAGDLTTLATLKAWLPAGTYSTASDDVLQRLITACSTFIQSWLNRTIASASYADSYNGQGNSRIVLRNYPVLAVAGVSIDGVAIPPRPPLGVGYGFGYVFDDISVMAVGYCFNRGYQNISVTYSAGFASTPADIEQACCDMIGDWFKYRDRIGKTSEGIEQQSITFTDTDIPKRSRGVLLQYRKVVPT